MEPLTPEQWRRVKEGDLLWTVFGPVLALEGAYDWNAPPSKRQKNNFDYWICVDADLVRLQPYRCRRNALSLTPPPDDW